MGSDVGRDTLRPVVGPCDAPEVAGLIGIFSFSPITGHSTPWEDRGYPIMQSVCEPGAVTV